MKHESNQRQAVELLQQLGLKEYEARCLVALARLPVGTAKEISEISDVPRTRVYDAIRVLETKGLVEVQHSNPQRFRSVSVEEAAETLRREYESRTDTLVETLANVEPVEGNDEEEVTHEVWSLIGTESIRTRTCQLIDSATEEVLFIVGHGGAVTDDVLERLQAANESGTRVLVGTPNAELRELVRENVPDGRVFVAPLEWLDDSTPTVADDTILSRLLLVDGDTILAGSGSKTETDTVVHEKAVFGKGVDNGLVVIARRLMATGLRSNDAQTVADG